MAFLRGYRRLAGYPLRYVRGWLLIVAVTLASTAFGLLQPWPLKILVDQVLGQEPMAESLAALLGWLPGGTSAEGLLAWIAVAGLVIFAVNSVAGVVLTWAWIVTGQRMVYDLAADLFSHVQRRSLLFHTRTPVGDSMTRITADCWAVNTMVNTLVFTPGHALITAIGMLWVMAALDGTLTLVAVIVAPLMVVASLLFGRPIKVAARTRRELESGIHAHIQQTLSGIAVVQAFGQEERTHRRFRELAASLIRAHQRGAIIRNMNELASGTITTLGTGVVLLVGAHRVLDGSLTLGTLLVFVSYLVTLQVAFKAFTGIYAGLKAAEASVDRVLEVLEAEPEVADRPGAAGVGRARGHVRLEGVTVGYEPGRPVLRGVTLEARPGETVALVGATGAGKSTLAALVPRFLDPWEGRVTLDGRDLRDLRLRDVRRQVALVLQEPFLLPVSVAENIAYGRPEAPRAEVAAAARAARAEEFIAALPRGYDTLIGERGATLSGGQRQRLAIARALLADAPILVLDEPTSALDAETERLLLEALERLTAGRTTLVIAHRLSTIRRADRIAVLDGGRVVEQGAHDELLARGGAYARLHRLQIGDLAAVAIGRAT